MPTVVRDSAYPEDHADEDGNDDIASACQIGIIVMYMYVNNFTSEQVLK